MTTAEILDKRSLSELAYVALLGLEPEPANLFAFQTLVGLLLTNGPGAISAQGAKGAVSADGPESPERVQLNKALVGFLTHSGYTHGGNGYEGIAFLLEQFRDADLEDPTDPKHAIDLKALAMRYVGEYARYKSKKKTAGSLDIQKIPGVNHPVFKDRSVNYDPREVYVREFFEKRGEYNVFHAYPAPVLETPRCGRAAIAFSGAVPRSPRPDGAIKCTTSKFVHQGHFLDSRTNLEGVHHVRQTVLTDQATRNGRGAYPGGIRRRVG